MTQPLGTPSAPPVAFVTGASSGIGRGLAVRLAREGYAVGLAARREDRLKEVAAHVRDHDGTASVHPCDVSDPQQVRRAAADCRAALGPVELLVANAATGLAGRHSMDDLDAEEVERVFRVNFMGAVYAVEAVLPDMLRRGSGQLVAVASVAGFGGMPGRAAYGASKAAMIHFFESLRLDLRPRGVAITVATPGFVDTQTHTFRKGRSKPFVTDVDSAVDRIARATLARRPAVAFPWQLVVPMGLARALPRALYDAVVARLPR